MAKANKTTKAAPAAKPAKAQKAAAVVRSAATVKAEIQKNPETSIFEVLQPFWFGGVVIKPPTFVEMTDAEAREYQEAGVLGTEPGEVPDVAASGTDTTQTTE